MAVPDFQSLMLPVLKALAETPEASVADLRNRVAVGESLSDGDLAEMLPSGRQSLFANRVGWALTHMMRAGLLERVRRAVYRLTSEGRKLLAESPRKVDMGILSEYAAYEEWSKAPIGEADINKDQSARPDVAETPEEALNRAAQQLRVAVEADVLDRVRQAQPGFLERVVVDLLIKMGYGSGSPSMGQVTGGPGDGGIDGKVREDKLGLDEIYVQAKRYTGGNTVGEGDLRNFIGALDAAGEPVRNHVFGGRNI